MLDDGRLEQGDLPLTPPLLQADAEHPSRLYWSAAPGDGRSVEDWSSAAASENVGGGHVEVGTDSDPITGLFALSNQLLIFKRDTLYRLLGDRPSNYRIYPVGAAMTQPVSSACVRYGDVLYFLTEKGLYYFDGQTAARAFDADKVRELLTDTCGVTGENADEILRFIACPGTSADKLAFLEQYRGRNETFDTGLDELRTVVGYLPAFGVPEENFELDLTIARGLDYYTGTVYETVLLDHPEVGSICSGGRYDDLAGYYTNKSLPGVGISIGLTRLFYILQEQNMISDAVLTAPADVLILPMTDDLSAAVALASELRAGGLRVQIYSEKKKFKAKIGYADKLGIPFVIFLGEDEVAQHVCALKNMATGVQEAVTSAAALETIRAEIARRSAGTILREP